MTGAAAAGALLEARRLAPDDDAPRLVWAGAVMAFMRSRGCACSISAA